MSKYTIADVANIIPVEQTAATTAAIEDYLNNGTIPPYDPCQSCEPNHIRKLIALIQVAERNGLFPPKKTAAKAKAKPKATPDPKPLTKGESLEGGYVAGIMSKDELDAIKDKSPELFEEASE